LELEYTFESNKIEGNTLTLQETDFIINEGLTISGKSMREHLEVLNHNEAIDYIKDLVQKAVSIYHHNLFWLQKKWKNYICGTLKIKKDYIQ
jgi:Fic family protein